MSNYLHHLQVRYGEIINKIYRIYGRFRLFHDLDNLPQLKTNNSLHSSIDTNEDKTVCLILGSKRTSSQFLLTAYLWKRYLSHTSIDIKLVSDGDLSQKVIDKAKKLLGDSTQIINAQNLLDIQGISDDQDGVKFKQFLRHHKFGRKFLSIYSFSQDNNVIYSDDDILLFRKPDEIIQLSKQDVNFAYSPDTSGCQCPFHNQMIHHACTLGVDPIWDFQAGLLYVKKGALDQKTINQYLSPWTIKNDIYFSEQTLFSLVFSHIKGGTKLPSESYIQNAAKGRFFWESDYDYTNPEIVLRHFVGTVRHRYFEVANNLINNLDNYVAH